MNIASSPSVQSATTAAKASGSDAVNILVLKKALDMQAISAATLLQTLPPVASLATSGNLGTKLNTFA